MKSKANTKKPVAEREAVVSPSTELEMAADRPEPALNKAEELYKSLFELSPVGIATIDLKGSRLNVLEVQGQHALLDELERIKPVETLISEDANYNNELNNTPGLRRMPPWHFELDSASRLLTQQMGTQDLKGFGCEHMFAAIAAAGCLLQYAKATQRTDLQNIKTIKIEQREDTVILEAKSRGNV